MSLSSIIAKIGVNPEFIAFQAHCWFAFAVVFVLGSHVNGVAVVFGVLGLAALKEFWFDATYEVPKQTEWDNWQDFLGYTTGVGLACLAHGLGL